jgi:CheY-like chemotaxis protein
MLVLIAEDDGLHRAFARTIVEELWSGDLEVLEASDGEDAIDLAARRDPSCVGSICSCPK